MEGTGRSKEWRVQGDLKDKGYRVIQKDKGYRDVNLNLG